MTIIVRSSRGTRYEADVDHVAAMTPSGSAPPRTFHYRSDQAPPSTSATCLRLLRMNKPVLWAQVKAADRFGPYADRYRPPINGAARRVLLAGIRAVALARGVGLPAAALAICAAGPIPLLSLLHVMWTGGVDGWPFAAVFGDTVEGLEGKLLVDTWAELKAAPPMIRGAARTDTDDEDDPPLRPELVDMLDGFDYWQRQKAARRPKRLTGGFA